jgi:phosphoglycolate phosphatase
LARTLLLDLDGTLADTLPDLTASLNELMQARGLPAFARAEVAPMVGDGVARLVQRAFAARDCEADAAAIAEYSAHYAEHAADATQAFPGVDEGLRSLARDGWRLGVCTNKPERAARSLLTALGLADYFAAIGGGDSFPARKPDPAHLLATLKAAGGEVNGAVMAGDHANDIAAARGAALPSIFAAWGYGPMAMAAGADAIAQDFAEMVQIARRL